MSEQAVPRKRRRIFPWFFLLVQAAFIAWIIGGTTSANSSADCEGLDAQTCADATAVGAGIGVALIIGLWVAVDIILGITWMIVRKR